MSTSSEPWPVGQPASHVSISVASRNSYCLCYCVVITVADDSFRQLGSAAMVLSLSLACRCVLTWGAGKFGQLGNNSLQDSMAQDIRRFLPPNAGTVVQVYTPVHLCIIIHVHMVVTCVSYLTVLIMTASLSFILVAQI